MHGKYIYIGYCNVKATKWKCPYQLNPEGWKATEYREVKEQPKGCDAHFYPSSFLGRAPAIAKIQSALCHFHFGMEYI